MRGFRSKWWCPVEERRRRGRATEKVEREEEGLGSEKLIAAAKEHASDG